MPEECIIDSAPPFAGWDFHITRNADWHDLFPQLLNAEEEPLNLTDATLQLSVKVAFGNTELLFLSTQNSPNELIIDDAENGLVSVHVYQGDVATIFEHPGVWRWWLRILHGGDGSQDEIARGNFYVHAS